GAWGGWLATALAVFGWWRAQRGRLARNEAVLRACHELRGPLTAVRLGLELGGRTGGLSGAQWRAIEGELDRVALALGDLQMAPTGKAASRTESTVDLRGLLADSVEAWRPSAAAAGVQLELNWAGGQSQVRGDRVRLAQATGNLIANAIEHGGGKVEVRGRQWDGGARIEVSDDGPGLPATVPRLTRGARLRGARGRGLAIVAGVAEAHGGRLAEVPTAAHDGDAGACLVLELPARSKLPS
ncbi:MAG: sensor histidine kinase, partial [Acidimicrobiales bacterium]